MAIHEGAFSDDVNNSVARDVAKIMQNSIRMRTLPEELNPYLQECKEAIQTLKLFSATDINEVAEVGLNIASKDLNKDFDSDTIKIFKNALGV